MHTSSKLLLAVEAGLSVGRGMRAKMSRTSKYRYFWTSLHRNHWQQYQDGSVVPSTFIVRCRSNKEHGCQYNHAAWHFNASHCHNHTGLQHSATWKQADTKVAMLQIKLLYGFHSNMMSKHLGLLSPSLTSHSPNTETLSGQSTLGHDATQCLYFMWNSQWSQYVVKVSD